jgi:hypothetical protein
MVKKSRVAQEGICCSSTHRLLPPVAAKNTGNLGNTGSPSHHLSIEIAVAKIQPKAKRREKRGRKREQEGFERIKEEENKKGGMRIKRKIKYWVVFEGKTY